MLINRTGRVGRMSTRITTGMTQRNVLADLNRGQRAGSRSTQAQDRLRTRDHAAVGRPVRRGRALALRQSSPAPAVPAQRRGRAGLGRTRPRTRWPRSPTSLQRARELLVQGGSDSSDASRRASAIADEIDQLIEGIKQSANANYRGRYVFAGTRDDHARRTRMGADDTYHGDDAGLTRLARRAARDRPRRDARASTSSAASVLGDGPRGDDGKLLDDAARHRRPTCARATAPALRGADLDQARRQPRRAARRPRRATARARTGSRSALAPPRPSSRRPTIEQLSETEDADIAKTLIDFNSQQAAYQAALKAGASIVQASLLDFLR